MRGTSCLFAGIALLLASGCGSKPVPLSALPGSTITLAVGGDDNPGFQPLRGSLGYGSQVYDAAFGPDAQRGELDVRLLDGSAEGFPLVTRMTFRVYPDPASDAGIGEVTPHPIWAPGVGIAQTLAILDIPSNAPPSPVAYPLQVRTVRRDATGAVVEVLNDMSHQNQELTILDPALCGVSGAPTPNHALMLDFYLEDSSFLLPTFVPHPKVLFDLHPGAHPGTPTPGLPAAAHVEINYPADVEILSVYEDRRLGRGSLVSWQNDPAADRLVVDLVAPNVSVRYLALAFQSTSVHAATDFGVDSAVTVLYDADGNDLQRVPAPVVIQ